MFIQPWLSNKSMIFDNSFHPPSFCQTTKATLHETKSLPLSRIRPTPKWKQKDHLLQPLSLKMWVSGRVGNSCPGGSWTNPSWNWYSSPIFGVNIKKDLKPPPSSFSWIQWMFLDSRSCLNLSCRKSRDPLQSAFKHPPSKRIFEHPQRLVVSLIPQTIDCFEVQWFLLGGSSYLVSG